MDLVTFVLLTAVVFLLYRYLTKGNGCDAPGPMGLPFVGYLPFLGKDMGKTLTEVGRKYGPVFQIQLGNQTAVVLNGADAVKETMNKWEYCDRPKSTAFVALEDMAEKLESSGIAFFPLSDRYHFLRKSGVRALNSLVVSESSKLEHYTKHALSYMESEFNNWNPKGADIGRHVFNSVNSVISSIVFGYHYAPDHWILTKMWHNREPFNDFMASSAVADFFPILRPFLGSSNDGLLKSFRDVITHLEKQIEDHEYNPEIVDLQDSLHQIFENSQDSDAWNASNFKSMKQAKNVSQDFFNAGTFTLMETFSYFTRICAAFPDVQEKIRDEIAQKVLKSEQYVGLAYREDLPYFSAVLEETQRHFSHVPFSISHATTKDVQFHGYHIPKGTVILPNLRSVHYDPKVFSNPDKFDPERFLKADGSFDEALSKYILPFGYGKRRCPGELLARRELFLLTVNFVRRFRMSSNVPNKESKLFESEPGFVYQLKPTPLILQRI